MRLAWCAMWLAAGLCGQTPSRSQFEVASLKPSGPLARGYPARTITGGPGNPGPGLITYREHSLKDLIFLAYRVQFFQLSTPGWMEQSYFDIVAQVPAGASRDDLAGMLQQLLRERFALQIHREQREISGYQLLRGEGDLKITPSPPLPAEASPTPAANRPGRLEVDKQGFIIVPPGSANIFYLPPKEGVARLSAARTSIATFCGYLGRLLQRPVADETGLKGVYDFRLAFVPESAAPTADAPGETASPLIPRASDPAPTLTRAIEMQLGLKMAKKRVPVEVLIIDHCERTPAGN
jgi:uncharacterized protein (TIGR03435 family)